MAIAIPLPIAKGGTGQAAAGEGSFSAGVDSFADSEYSLSVGYGNETNAQNSAAIGQQNTTNSPVSFCFGSANQTTGIDGGLAIGVGNTAGTSSHSIGISNTTQNYSSAFGLYNILSGNDLIAAGSYNSTNNSKFSSSFGYGNNISNSINCNAFGYGNVTTNPAAFGYNNTSIGVGNSASGVNSLSVGVGNGASGTSVYSVGEANNSSGQYCTALGYSNSASVQFCTSVGTNNGASGSGSGAFGNLNSAQGVNASAFGDRNESDGNYTSAFGFRNKASAFKSSAFGYGCYGNGMGSTAFGYLNTADGAYYSSAFGYGNIASGQNSGAFGYNVKTTRNNTTEFGFWSDSSTRGGSIRTDSSGMAALTTASGGTPLADGGITAGAEVAGTLPRGSVAFRTSGDNVYIDYNNAGVVKTNGITIVRGQASRITTGTVPSAGAFTQGVYQSVQNAATLDSATAAGIELGTGDFSLKNISGTTRVFNVSAGLEILHAGGTLLYGIKLAKNGTPIDQSEMQENVSNNNPGYLSTEWMVSLADGDEVSPYMACVNGTAAITLNRARIIVTSID